MVALIGPVRERCSPTTTRASVTPSTCATQQDHAAGGYWSDDLLQPEHRIDRIGVLVARRG
jgi:sortase A